jgi:hypothetical protein
MGIAKRTRGYRVESSRPWPRRRKVVCHISSFCRLCLRVGEGRREGCELSREFEEEAKGRKAD